MSWLSSFLHNPLDYTMDHPWKTLGLVTGASALTAAPFVAPELLAGAGAFGAEAGAVGAADAAATGSFLGDIGTGIGSAVSGAGTALSDFAGTVGQGINSVGNAIGDALPFSQLEGAPGVNPNALADAGAQSFMNNPGGALPDLTASPSLDTLSYTPNEVVQNGFNDVAPQWNDAAPPGGASPQDAANAALEPPIPDPYGAPGSPATSAAPGTPGSPPGLWDATKAYAMSHPFQAAGAGIAGLGLVNNILQGQRTSPEMKAISGNAGAMNQQSQVMMKYLTSGTLPPGLDQAIKLSTQAAEANAVANAARNGMPTNPTQNTALAQQLSSIRNNAVADIAKMGTQLMSQGLSMAQISNQLYLQLEQLNRQQARDTGVAIANFAAALNGGGTMRAAAR